MDYLQGNTENSFYEGLKEKGKNFYNSGLNGLSKILVAGSILGATTLGVLSCKNDSISGARVGGQSYSLSSSPQTVETRLLRPETVASLSDNLSKSKSKDLTSLNNSSRKYFATRPSFFEGGSVETPVSLREINESSTETVYEFSDNGPFSKGIRFPYANGKYESVGLRNSLTTEVLENGDIEYLIIPNNHSEFLRIVTDPNGNLVRGEEKALSNDELVGITSLYTGSDGNLYGAQTGVWDIKGETNLIRQPRLISIDSNGVISEGVSLPVTQNRIIGLKNEIEDNVTYGGHTYRLGDFFIRAPNSDAGKTENGFDSYILSVLDRYVKGEANGTLTDFLSFERPLLDIAVDPNNGSLYGIEAPLLAPGCADDPANCTISVAPELAVFDPANGTRESLHTFSTENLDFTGATGNYVRNPQTISVGGQNYVFDNLFSSSIGLHYDTGGDLVFDITDTHGNLRRLTFTVE